MTAASPFPLSPEPRRPARVAILLALALHAAVPIVLGVLPLLAPSARHQGGPREIEVEIAQLQPPEPPAPPPEPETARETAPAPEPAPPPPPPPPTPPLPEFARLLDPPKPLLEQAPIGDVSRAEPGPDAEPAASPPPSPPPEAPEAQAGAARMPEPALPEPALPEPAEASLAPPPATTLPEPAPPAEAPRQETKPPQEQRQQPQRQERPAERKPPPAKPPEAGKARVDGPSTGGRGRDAQRRASASEARQQSEGDFVLAQIMPFWLIDMRSPRFRDVVMGGVFALQEDGMLAPPFGKHDPWRPEVMIENYRELLKPQAEPVRVALESFLRAARDAQPFQLPPGVRGYPRPIRITLKMGDR
jgi:hypothetical protein